MKKNQILIIVIVTVLTLIASAFAIIYFATDMFKSEQEMFYKYAKKIDIKQFLKTEGYAQYLNRLGSENYGNHGEISFRINAGEEQIQESIKYNGYTNPESKMSNYDISINKDEEPLLEMNYIRNQNKYGIQFKDVVKQYIVVENENLKQFAEKIGMKDTSKIPDSIDLSEITGEIDYEKIPNILNKYLNIVIASIGEENFSKIEKGNISLGDTTVNADGYQIKLSIKDIQVILRKVLETAKNDEDILNMLSVGNLEQEDYKEKIEELLEDLSTEIPNESDFDIITIGVYKQGKDTIKLVVKVAIEDITNIEISIENTAKGTRMNFINTNAYDEQEKSIITISKLSNTEENEEVEIVAIQEDEEGKKEILRINSSRNGAFSSDEIEFDFIISSNLDIPFNMLSNSTSVENLRAEFEFKDSINFADIPTDKNLAEEKCVVINEMELKRIETVLNKVATLLGEKLKDEMFVSMFISTKSLFNNALQVQQQSQSLLGTSISKMEEQEKQLFNSSISMYEGAKVSGSSVKQLIKEIDKINAEESKHKVVYAYLGEASKGIQNTRQYKVTANKDKDGYINQVTIEISK